MPRTPVEVCTTNMTAAVHVENLSKCYRLGARPRSIRDLVNATARRWFGRSIETPVQPSMHAGDRRAQDGQFWALNDISFEVQPGEIVGVIGRNGSGKSTLLKVLSQIVTPTTGRVKLNGRVASLLEVGTGFHPELTGRENVYLNSAILGMSKSEVRRKFDDIVSFAEVDQFIDTPVKRYSSGMYVRLAFAVAAHLESEILIVDEVLAVGDVEFQERCLGKINDVSRHGRTVMFVSHNVASIRQLTQRCILLQQGELEFDGRTEEALARYIRRGQPDNFGLAFDVESIERPFNGLTNEIRFCRLTLVSETSDGFLKSGKLSFQAVLRQNAPVTAFRFSVTIYRDDHVPVGTCFSDRMTPAGSGTTFSLTMTLNDLPLAGGEFYCGVSVGDYKSQGWVIYDSVTEVLGFRVTPERPRNGSQAWHACWGPIGFPNIMISRTGAQDLSEPAPVDDSKEACVSVGHAPAIV